MLRAISGINKIGLHLFKDHVLQIPSSTLTHIQITTLLIEFVERIGLTVEMEAYDEKSFLPGVRIKSGGLSINTERLLYPGDILHEAGHLAVMPLHIRRDMDGDLPDVDMHRAGELMALAWSYAACLHLKISPSVVFHEQGYKGGHKELIAHFEEGANIGLPMLQYHGMAYDAKNAALHNEQPFPHMIHWLCLKEE